MPPRPKRPSQTISNKLLEAVNFLSSITKDEGAPFETHVLLQNRTATAFNGILAAGCLIDEDLAAAPHNDTFQTALKHCGEQYSITQLDSGKLSIKAGRFRALVPCIDPSLLSCPIPDNPCAAIDDRMKEGLATLENIKADNAQRVVTQSFLLNGRSIIATDSKIIVELWHGIDLPSGLAIPKALIPAISKCNKKLSQFGFSSNSVTFYFEDNSWIRSQLYAEQWPNVSFLLDKPNNATDIPKGFYEAVDAVEPFTDDGTVFFNDNILQSHRDKEKGATFEVPGLIGGPAHVVKYLDIIKPYAEKIDFSVPAENNHGYLLMFYGKNVRGIVAGVNR